MDLVEILEKIGIVFGILMGSEVFIGMLPNKWVPYMSRILKVLHAVNEK